MVRSRPPGGLARREKLSMRPLAFYQLSRMVRVTALWHKMTG